MDNGGWELLSLILLAAFAGLWLDSLKARDAGIAAARDACLAEGMQLLDDTVSFSGLGLARDSGGVLRLRRAYNFEYSDTGDNRRRGSIVLLGHQVVLINIGLRAVPSGHLLH